MTVLGLDRVTGLGEQPSNTHRRKQEHYRQAWGTVRLSRVNAVLARADRMFRQAIYVVRNAIDLYRWRCNGERHGSPVIAGGASAGDQGP